MLFILHVVTVRKPTNRAVVVYGRFRYNALAYAVRFNTDI